MEYKYSFWLFVWIILLLNSCHQSTQNETHKEREKLNHIKLNSVVGEIKTVPTSIAKFIPKGFATLDTATGDLNMDGISDVILVLKPEAEDTSEENKSRPVLILIGSESGQYNLVSRNDNVAYCYRCGGVWGDPFMGIAIKNSYFSIENGISAGKQHWEHILTFKYEKSKANWYLSRDGFVSYKLNSDTSGDASTLVKETETIKTAKDLGQVPFSQFNIRKDWK